MAEETVHAVVFRDPVSGQWVGMCLEYDVVTQGDNEDHAFAMVADAVELLLSSASPEEIDDARQPIDGEPVMRRIAVRASSLLNR